MKQSKSIPLKTVWYYNRRAFGFWWKTARAAFASTVLYGLVSASAPYVTIYFTARLINEIGGSARAEVMFRLALVTLLTASLFSLAEAALKRWKNAVYASLHYREHGEFVRKFMDMDFCDVDHPYSSDLYSQIMQNENWDGWGLRRVQEQFENLFTALVTIAGGLLLSVTLFTSKVPDAGGLSFLNHPLCLAAVFAAMLAAAVFSPLFSNKAGSYWGKYAKDATFGNRVFSYFGFIAEAERERAMEIRTYGQEQLFRRKMQAENTFGHKSKIALWSRGIMGFYQSVSSILSRAFTGIVYLFVCLKAWAGAFGAGSVTRYIGSVTALAGGAAALIRTAGEMRNNVPYLKMAFELLDIPNRMYQGSLTVEKRSDRNYEIEFRNVSFHYPASESEDGDGTEEIYALKNVSLKFKIGERLAVVGQNGSGKTTMIKLLCRLYDPKEGEILLNGIDIRKYNYREYMSLFSVVFQDFKLLGFSLGENVAGSETYDKNRVSACLKEAGFADRLAGMEKGLDTCLYKNFEPDGVEISGGEAQKIAIARALYKDSPFIVLDEPTAALDPIAEAEIYAKFNTLIQDKTAVYISHRLSSCRFCDRIAVFDKGQIVQFGSHEELVKQTDGKYYELWHAQAQYYA